VEGLRRRRRGAGSPAKRTEAEHQAFREAMTEERRPSDPTGESPMSDFCVEFPDDPVRDIPPELLQAPWEDRNWHNDTCPAFSMPIGTGREAHVLVDYVDPKMREWQSGRRFHLYHISTGSQAHVVGRRANGDRASDQLDDEVDRVSAVAKPATSRTVAAARAEWASSVRHCVNCPAPMTGAKRKGSCLRPARGSSPR
jgi:hypothetical protein